MKEPNYSNSRGVSIRSSKVLVLIAIGLTLFLCYFVLFPTSTSSISTDLKTVFIKSQLLASEQAYQLYVKKRKAIATNLEKIDPWPKTSHTYFYDYFLPAFNCPYTIQRTGQMGDGGKWTCGFELYTNPQPSGRPCIVYSFGVAHESSYEAEFLERTDCEIYAYDASVNKMGPQVKEPVSPKLHFTKMFIGTENNDKTNTLGHIMRENGHKWIDFLKMDIEEQEFPVLKQIVEEFDILPFGQMQIEFHGDNEGKIFPEFYKLWEKLETKGLRAFKNEVNHWPCVGMQLRPFLMEYSYINIKGDHRIIN